MVNNMGFRPTILTLQKGNVTSQSNIANVDTEIIDILVPRNMAYRFKFGTPILMYLYTLEIFAGTGVPQNVTLSQELVNANLPNVNGKAYLWDTVGNVWLDGYTVTPGVVNQLSDTFPANNVEVYYVWSSVTERDIVSMKVADANKERFTPILRRPLDNWSRVNQYAVQERQELRNELLLPEKSHLLIYLNSDVTTVFPGFAYFEMKVLHGSMAAANPAEFVKFQ